MILTCDQEVCEGQKAAAAEADGTVGGSQPGQEEETAGQFTNTQHHRSFQHTVHGYNKTTHTHQNWLLFASGWRSTGMPGTLLTINPPNQC